MIEGVSDADEAASSTQQQFDARQVEHSHLQIEQ